jgi:hypothetical protein
MFTDAGWFCTRAAASQSPMDLIAYADKWLKVRALFEGHGYTIKESRARKIPSDMVAIKTDRINERKVYYTIVGNLPWLVVLMQCKIKKRRRAKARR